MCDLCDCWQDETGLWPLGTECESCGLTPGDLPFEMMINFGWENFFTLEDDGWMCNGCQETRALGSGW